MSASELFQAGHLQEAVDQAVKEVKASPTDAAKRVFLFELLSFNGDLERAAMQLNAVRYDNPGQEAGKETYKKLVQAEGKRRDLFDKGIPPKFFAPPPPYVQNALLARDRLADGKPAEAIALLDEAEQTAPALRGKLNDREFNALRDGDDLLAHVLEVLNGADYYWVPLADIQSVKAESPDDPRDLLWFPVTLELKAGHSGQVFLPALYPGSHAHEDQRIRLGRYTDWVQEDGRPVRGVGQKTFLIDEDDIGLLEWRTLEFAG